jgi:hypothetical protein
VPPGGDRQADIVGERIRHVEEEAFSGSSGAQLRKHADGDARRLDGDGPGVSQVQPSSPGVDVRTFAQSNVLVALHSDIGVVGSVYVLDRHSVLVGQQVSTTRIYIHSGGGPIAGGILNQIVDKCGLLKVVPGQ